MKKTPSWLKRVVDKIRDDRAIIISFNWDLVLDQILFGEDLAPNSYGLDPDYREFPRLLKPHGSLNWFEGPQAKVARPRKALSSSFD